jgi:hypothetical protein
LHGVGDLRVEALPPPGPPMNPQRPADPLTPTLSPFQGARGSVDHPHPHIRCP